MCKRFYSRKTNTTIKYFQYYNKSNSYHQVNQLDKQVEIFDTIVRQY